MMSKGLQGRRGGRSPGGVVVVVVWGSLAVLTQFHFTLQAGHVCVLPAPKFNTSLLVLTLPLSQAGPSVVTAEE